MQAARTCITDTGLSSQTCNHTHLLTLFRTHVNHSNDHYFGSHLRSFNRILFLFSTTASSSLIATSTKSQLRPTKIDDLVVIPERNQTRLVTQTD
jgi:hypothetical protein